MNITYKIKRSFNLENNINFKIIKHCNFNIAKRLKTIDNNLYLVFNEMHNVYEVHDVSQNKTTYALTFSDLNGEILDIVKKVKHRDTIDYSRSQSFLKRRFEEYKENKILEDRAELTVFEDLINRV